MTNLKAAATLSLLVCASATGVEVQRTLQEISWARLNQAGRLAHLSAAARVLPPGMQAEFEQLRLQADGQARLKLVTIEKPGVTAVRYAVIGSIRYEGVKTADGRKGHLEMWSHFPGTDPCFTRTLADAGPMQAIVGASGWRSFCLPFDRTGSRQGPTRLEVNLVLPAGGTVYLGPLRLVERVDDPRIPRMRAPGAGWWSDPTGGWIGGTTGTLLGALCALVALLGAKAVARRFALAVLVLMAVAGAAGLAAGIVAAATSQPYGVYYVLLLGGGLYAGMAALGLALVPRLYRAAELRRIRAMDA